MPKVLLTRPPIRSNKQDELHQLLTLGGIVIQELPMLNFELPRETSKLDAALSRAAMGQFEFIILSSPTAVHFFEQRVRQLELFDPLRVSGKFGAVGQVTANELTARGFKVELPIPSTGGSHQLAALLSMYDMEGKPILLLQSQIGLEVIEHSLVELGAVPERVTLYYSKGPTLGDAARLLHLLESPSRPDVIVFFSPSSVSYFIRALAEMASGMLHHLPALACIGETTAKAVEEGLHRRPEIVARKADQASLAEDILTYLGLYKQRN